MKMIDLRDHAQKEVLNLRTTFLAISDNTEADYKKIMKEFLSESDIENKDDSDPYLEV